MESKNISSSLYLPRHFLLPRALCIAEPLNKASFSVLSETTNAIGTSLSHPDTRSTVFFSSCLSCHFPRPHALPQHTPRAPHGPRALQGASPARGATAPPPPRPAQLTGRPRPRGAGKQHRGGCGAAPRRGDPPEGAALTSAAARGSTRARARPGRAAPHGPGCGRRPEALPSWPRPSVPSQQK